MTSTNRKRSTSLAVAIAATATAIGLVAPTAAYAEPSKQETYAPVLSANGIDLTATIDRLYSSSFSSDDCLTKAPKNTLRNGAEEIGLRRICSQAVDGAATPEAARAIKEAIRNLGAPYTDNPSQRTLPGMFDCSSFVTRAYQVAGIDTMTRDGRYPVTVEIRDSSDWARDVSKANAQPGDLVVYYTGMGFNGHHVVMYLGKIRGQEWIIHTNNTGDVAHITTLSNSISNAAWLRVRGTKA